MMYNGGSLMPRVGLSTISALTPSRYEIRLVDLNCKAFTEDDLDWADIVCFPAMLPRNLALSSGVLQGRTQVDRLRRVYSRSSQHDVTSYSYVFYSASDARSSEW